MLRYRFIFYIFSGTLIVVSAVVLVWFGLPLGPEFRGGSLLEADFGSARVSSDAIAAALMDLHLEGLQIQHTKASGAILRFGAVDERTHPQIVVRLRSLANDFSERRFTAIGPALGRELLTRSIVGILLAFVGILVYVAVMFRQVKRARSGREPSSWLFGFIGVGALAHDVFISAGLVTAASRFTSLEFGGAFIAALLTIAGYSINDTIIIFDRIREHMRLGWSAEPSLLINSAVRATLRRSLFTSLTTLLALVAILFFGGATLRLFALTLSIGIVIGTYSSIAIAAPLLYDLDMGRGRR